MTEPNPSIPLREAAICIDCAVVFSMTGNCPGCGTSIGWTPVESNLASAEFKRLRERLSWVTAALHQIAYGSHTREFKSKVADRALEYMKREEPDAANARPIQKGITA